MNLKTTSCQWNRFDPFPQCNDPTAWLSRSKFSGKLNPWWDKSRPARWAAALFVKFHWQITSWGKSNANVAVPSILSHSQKPYPCLPSACFEYTRCKLGLHSLPVMQIHRWVQFKYELVVKQWRNKRAKLQTGHLLEWKNQEKRDVVWMQHQPGNTQHVWMEVWKS